MFVIVAVSITKIPGVGIFDSGEPITDGSGNRMEFEDMDAAYAWRSANCLKRRTCVKRLKS